MIEDDSFAATPEKAPDKKAPRRVEDLSEQITRAVEKRPGDEVRCTWVSGDKYRCNWWAQLSTDGYDNPSMAGLLVTTHRVRRSRFLHVTREAGKLVITELAEPPSHREGGGDQSAR
jgi:hypothetical protein